MWHQLNVNREKLKAGTRASIALIALCTSQGLKGRCLLMTQSMLLAASCNVIDTAGVSFLVVSQPIIALSSSPGDPAAVNLVSAPA